MLKCSSKSRCIKYACSHVTFNCGRFATGRIVKWFVRVCACMWGEEGGEKAGCIEIPGLMCSHAALCAHSGIRLEIKTLCGTELMIGVELKQKAEEQSELKGERREREASRLGGKGASARLCCSPTACVSGMFLIRMSGGPFPLTCSCQQSG